MIHTGFWNLLTSSKYQQLIFNLTNIVLVNIASNVAIFDNINVETLTYWYTFTPLLKFSSRWIMRDVLFFFLLILSFYCSATQEFFYSPCHDFQTQCFVYLCQSQKSYCFLRIFPVERIFTFLCNTLALTISHKNYLILWKLTKLAIQIFVSHHYLNLEYSYQNDELDELIERDCLKSLKFLLETIENYSPNRTVKPSSQMYSRHYLCRLLMFVVSRCQHLSNVL